MKKILYLLFFYCLSLSLSAQEISVKSFQPLPNDLTARVNPVKNDNAQSCALVKIVTTEQNFDFEPDALGICQDVEYKTGEIWLWLSPGSRRLTIKHSQLGVLRNYEYPVAIESACTYEMVLVTGRLTTIIEQVNKENYLALTIFPPEAAIKIDGNMEVLKKGTLQKMYAVGKHTYEAYCDMYYPQQGSFNISPDETTELQVTLKPNYGRLKVTSSPESGATVYLNSRNVGTTPWTSDKLPSGDYTVQVVKELYQDVTRQVTVMDDNTSEVDLVMSANYAEPTFVCKDEEAEIWINDEYKGVGRWHGRLPVGNYRIETRKASHQTMGQSLALANGNTSIVTLQIPTPICGSLNVISDPFGADILLNGKKIGSTPKIINNVLIGKYELKLQKDGYSTVTKNIVVSEGKTTDVNGTLASGREVMLKSNPAGATLFVDGEPKGIAPQTITLAFGNHKVEAQLGEVRDSKNVAVTEGGPNEWTLNVQQVFVCGTTIKDADGNEYNTVKIGNQCWMKENMRTTTDSVGNAIPQCHSMSYKRSCRYMLNDDISRVSTCGYLYNHEAAMKICPRGWHLPSMDEYAALTDYCKQHYAVNGGVGKTLATKTGWNSYSGSYTIGNNQSTNNASGFSVLPCSCYNDNYNEFGLDAGLWSTSPGGSSSAYGLRLYYYEKGAFLDDDIRNHGYSVRCIRNKDR